MKKTYITLCVLTVLTAASYGQLSISSPSSWPNSLNLQNWTLDTAYGGPGMTAAPLNMAGEYVLDPTQNYETSTWRELVYTRTSPDGSKTSIKFFNNGENGSVGAFIHGKNSSGGTFLTFSYSGTSLTNLSYNGSQNWQFTTPPGALFDTAWVANGLDAGGGFFVGGTPSQQEEGGSGGGSVFIEQAQQLNIGLEFQDGQWTPAQ